MPTTPAILAEGLYKSYGKTAALSGLNLLAEQGTILGVLGPNGAGKTTVVRILTTLLKPDRGRAQVAGLDVVRQARTVRARIGLAGQYAAVDELLTGEENLRLFGTLSRLTSALAARRAWELLERLDLVAAARRLVKTYSGGMRRRLDLAACLILAPPVLFLDEPTTGLDPLGRRTMWSTIQELAAAGTTVFLTTQYLEEADHLAHHIAILDHGRVLTSGTADELKARIGGPRLVVTLTPVSNLQVVVEALRPHSAGAPRLDAEHHQVIVPMTGEAEQLTAIVRDLAASGAPLADVAVRRPTLDDVFLTLTGQGATQATPAPAAVEHH